MTTGASAGAVETVRVPVSSATGQVRGIFERLGVPSDEAELATDVLVSASLRGVDTHGVSTVVRYARELQDGVCKPIDTARIVSRVPSVAHMDAADGLGLVTGQRAMEWAISAARTTGVGQVAMSRAHHLGMLAYYPLMAVRAGMIGMVVSNASRAVRPAGGLAARVGVNPMAFAAPAGDEPPFVFDMSTSMVAGSKIAGANRRGEPLGSGWAVDAAGQPLVEAPANRSEAWSMNPLGGGEGQAHKGFGLGLIVDILGGVLSGGGYSAQLSMGQNMSWLMAVDIGAFRPLADFRSMMDEMVREIRSTPPEIPGQLVRVPGEGAERALAERSREGIPLEASQVRAIREKAAEVGAPVLI